MPSLFSSVTFLAAITLASAYTPAPAPTAAPIEKRDTTSPLPLYSYTYAYDQIPYQVNPYAVGRGPQSGYNVCNSTTQGASSDCQTLEITSLSDFCLWGAPGTTGGETIGDIEAAVVAYCIQSGHGGRTITPGAVTAAQFMRTSAYIQITGLFDQTSIGLAANDTGGELDPHGDDNLGNPVGGLVYSQDPAFAVNGSYGQVHNWNLFVGSGTFCFKACFNNITSPDYCENTYDIIGCNYNMPASYTPNEFTSCDGELQDEVGRYTVEGSTQILTWSEPASLSADETLPWTPRIPASSNCQTFSSAALYAASTTSASAAATSTSAGASAYSTGTNSANSRSGSSSSATKTSTSSAAASTSAKPASASTLSIQTGMGLFAAGALVLCFAF